ncbi:hypothetical protein PIB30_008546 [Stylosanthes scabra]|uniref:SWIM-type domain-containing protein n=1 Tax=Stylosanthes scabra TaxID=79078 RepID=A0ABU6Z4P1_9FABA|nr:hypothetical protein [Stylosanthes scabra]
MAGNTHPRKLYQRLMQSSALKQQGRGVPATLSSTCSDSSSKWEMVCLDVDANNNIVTNSCKCLSKDTTCFQFQSSSCTHLLAIHIPENYINRGIVLPILASINLVSNTFLNFSHLVVLIFYNLYFSNFSLEQ